MVHRFGALLLALILARVAQPMLSDGNAAPTRDRVGFPNGYQQSYTVLRSFVKEKQQQLVTIYGNQLAASVTETRQLPYPYGSILVMETANLLNSDKKSKGQIRGSARDAAGTGLREELRQESDRRVGIRGIQNGQDLHHAPATLVCLRRMSCQSRFGPRFCLSGAVRRGFALV